MADKVGDVVDDDGGVVLTAPLAAAAVVGVAAAAAAAASNNCSGQPTGEAEKVNSDALRQQLFPSPRPPSPSWMFGSGLSVGGGAHRSDTDEDDGRRLSLYCRRND